MMIHTADGIDGPDDRAGSELPTAKPRDLTPTLTCAS